MDKVIAFLILMLGIVIVYLAPSSYSFNYSALCCTLYFLVVLTYYLFRRKVNFFDFDSLFFFTFFFVMFYFPIFMYETDAERYFMFVLPYDENVIPKASSIALLGASSYISGNLFFISGKEEKLGIKFSNAKEITFSDNRKKISNDSLYVYSIILFLFYIGFGGYNEMKALYSGTKFIASGLANYFIILSPAFLYSAIIIEFFNLRRKTARFKLKNVNKLAFVAIGLIFFSMLAAGSRTIPLQIVLLITCLYSLIFYNVSFTKYLVMITSGLIIMFGVVLFRGYEQDTKVVYGDIVMDLVVNNRSSFLAVEKVNKEGFTYGESMISGLTSPIPFLQNLLIYLGVDKNKISSSILFTRTTFEDEDINLGLGTNVIADVYIAFGTVGVVVFFMFLGYIVNIKRINNYRNIYNLAIYGIFASYSVYIVRAEYFFFLRNMLWTLLIIYLITKKTKLRYL